MMGLYKKLYAKPYDAKLDNRDIATLNWRLAVLREFRPRIARPLARKPDFVLYTDAALLNNRIAAVLFRKQDSAHPKIRMVASSQAPKYWATEFIWANMIYGL